MMTQVAEGIDFIQRGWVNANMVLLRGRHSATRRVETCVIDPGHFTFVEQTLELLSAENITPSSITSVVATHSHWDHCSAINLLREHGNFDVLLPVLTDEWMRQKALREMWLDYFGVTSRTHFCEADSVLNPGLQVELGGRIWETVALPGHAPDTLGYFQPDEGVLISADSIMSNGDCGLINTVVHGQNALDDALATVDLIESLKPRVILPGHGPLVFEVQSCIEKLRRRLQRFKSEPSRHVSHLARRIVMAGALEIEPQPRDALVALMADSQWAMDYADLIDNTPQQLVGRTVTELLFGGALVEQAGKLVANVPR